MLYSNYMAGSFLHAWLYSATGQYLNDSVILFSDLANAFLKPAESSSSILCQALEILESVYNFQWYKCNVKVQRSLLMVIRCSQSGSGLKVPFFVANLGTFMAVS